MKRPTLEDTRQLALRLESERGKKEGMAKVEANGDEEWQARAMAVILKLCQEREDWFCDDIWAQGLPQPRNGKLLGVVVQRAARLKLCVATDRLRKSVHSHGSGKVVWKSILRGSVEVSA